MKTILIPNKEKTTLGLSLKLEEIGLIGLERNENKIPIKFKYIKDISERPKTPAHKQPAEIRDVYEYKTFSIEQGKWLYFRVDVSEKGEKILKSNNIKFEYE